ncbi:MAG: MipA/OmpV family protein [Pseudomonadota bacterium]
MRLGTFRIFTAAVAATICSASFLAERALAQQHADEPNLSPMIFGETEEERREKIRQEQEREREALRISVQQDEDSKQIDDPRLRPLLFGEEREDRVDPTGTEITLGPEDENRSFFGSLNFLVPAETNLSLGVGPVYEPDYLGSDDYEFDADPQVYVKFRNVVFLDDDGADLALLGFSRFRVGPSLRIRGRRDQDENPALFGTGDVGTTFEFGGFVSTTFLKRFNSKIRVRHGIKTGHRGTVIDARTNALLFRTGRFSFGAAGNVTWVGERFADAFFSITPEQSARSSLGGPPGALPVFDAGRGFQSFGGSATAYINIAKRWSLNPYVQYDRLLGDFAESPIVSQFGDRNQVQVGFHIQREFTFRMRGRRKQ